MLEAVGILCSDGTARPTGFLRPNSKWSRLLRTQSDHRLWETAVLFHLRDAFRAGDVWLARSRRYGDIRKALLSAPAVADADHSPPVPASPHDWLAERRFAPGRGPAQGWPPRRGPVRSAGGSIEDSVLRVERTEGAVPDGAADLVADLYRRMPDARITDILLEVDDATRFTEAFTHLRTGEPCRDRIGLLNVLLAEGINLGLRKMAEATTTHGFWELMRIARWHVEGDAFDRALAVVVEAQAALPMAAFWGTGRTASSDGQFFPAGGRGEALNLVNARYGAEPGVKAYSHVSDRFSPFATQTIPATVHEAPYILDGLLMNETGRRIREQYADTGGFTDHVFAACSSLGYAFVPRIWDLPSKRLYVFERAGVPKHLRPLVGGKVNVDLIDRNWADILRVAATYLYDKPYSDPKRVRVAGPFTVESLSPHRLLAFNESDELIDRVAERAPAYGTAEDFAAMAVGHRATSGVQQAHKADRITFSSIDPWPGERICAEGRYTEGEDGPERRAAIVIGPEFGTVSRQDLVRAAREAAEAGFDALIACAFNFEPPATEFNKLGALPAHERRPAHGR